MSDISGSDYDTISDISSLGSYAESYAIQAAQDAAAKEAAKRRRRSTKLRNRVNSEDTEDNSSKRRNSTRRKSKMPESKPLTEETLAAQQRQEARKTKRMKLKGLNDRILGVEDDLSDFGDSKSADDTTSAPATVVVAPLVSVSAPESPLRPRSPQVHDTPHASRQPSRAPSPKINLLGSSRVAPSVPAEATAQPQPNNQEMDPIPTQLPPFSPQPSPAGVVTTHSPPVEAASALSEVGSRPGSSLGGTFSTPSPRGSFASSTGGKNVMPSAVSERRKAAAAARAAKMSSKNNQKDPNAPMEATQETASNASSATAPTSTDREVSGESVRVREPASVPAIAKAKSKRRIARSGGSSGSSEASSESEEFSSSEDDEDERLRKRRKAKQKEKEKLKQKEKEKEKERERRAKEKQKEEKEREKEKEKERARREKEAEEERLRKEEAEKEARRAEKKSRKEREEADVSPPSSSSSSSSAVLVPAPMLNNRSLSFGGKRSKDPYCRLIKSSTYLNAIRIVHGDVPKVLCASADSTVQIHSILDGSQLTPLVGHTDRVISLAVSNPFMYAEKSSTGASGKPTLKTLVASGSRDEQLRIWDMDTGRCLHAIHAHKSPIWAVGIAVRPDGDVIVVTTSGDGTMRSWNGKTGKKINNFKGHSDKILSVFIMNPLAEVPLVLSAGSDKKIRVWDLLTGAHIRMLEGHEDEINSVVAGAFSGISSLVPIRPVNESSKEHSQIPGLDPGKSTVIVSGSKDLTVRVWDFRSGHLLFELLGHTACVYEVALIRARDSSLATSATIPAGTPIIVSCSEDATVKLWNLVTGKLIASQKWHNVSVRGIDVASVSLQGGDASSGTALIASCGWDKTIQFHELGEALCAKKASMCSIM